MSTDATRAKRFYERGLYFYRIEKWSDAAVNLRDALELMPDHVSARMHLGVSLAKQRQLLEAIKLLEEGRQRPNISEEETLKLVHLLGTLCMVRQDYPAAEYYFKMALGAKPEAFHLHNLLATTLCKAGRYEEGLDAFQRAIAISGRD